MKMMGVCVAVIACSVCVVQATQIVAGNTMDFTPSSATASTVKTWSLPVASWDWDSGPDTQFASSVYSYNSKLANSWRKVTTLGSANEDLAGGGLVIHFKSSQAVAMNVAMSVAYRFGNWGGHVCDVYFSDENNWSNLDEMVGGTWWAGTETNSKWQQLLSDRIWGSRESTIATLPSSGTLTTADGDFWVRVDIHATDGSDASFITLEGLDVAGTVVPEPMTMALLAMGGAAAMIRRRMA